MGHIAITAIFHLYLFIFFYEAGNSHVKCNTYPLQSTSFNLQVPLIQVRYVLLGRKYIFRGKLFLWETVSRFNFEMVVVIVPVIVVVIEKVLLFLTISFQKSKVT